LKIILTIFKTQNDYYAVIDIEKLSEFLSNKEVVYQDIQEEKNRVASRTTIKEMKEKAIEWAQKEGIFSVFNLDSYF